MGVQVRCPRCSGARQWTLGNGKRRCATCRYDWKPRRLPLYLTPRQWRQLLHWFLVGLSGAQIAEETKLRRERVLRALLLVREAMAWDIPPVFSGTVEIDETYLGGDMAQQAAEGARSGYQTGPWDKQTGGLRHPVPGWPSVGRDGAQCGGQDPAAPSPGAGELGLGGVLGHLQQLHRGRGWRLRPPAGGP